MNNREKLNSVLQNLNDTPNKDLVFCLDYLNEEFESTKISIIKLTEHLDKVEMLYNRILKELEGRNNAKK
jgi:hypothetical protein